MVSESELIGRLREFLRSSDLNTTTTATVRRQLESDFGIDLSDRKAFIREQVDLFLQTEHQPQQPEEEEQDDDQEEPQNDDVEESQHSDSKEETEEEEEDGDNETKPKRAKAVKKKNKERLVSFFHIDSFRLHFSFEFS